MLENFKTKKALREAVEKNLKGEGPPVMYKSNALHQLGVTTPSDGIISIEGPHFPKPHRWYAECIAENWRIISVR